MRERDRIDDPGRPAGDGSAGVRHDPGGNHLSVIEAWSPIELRNLVLDGGVLTMEVENRYDFTSLDRCKLKWRAVRLARMREQGGPCTLATGDAAFPEMKPGEARAWNLRISVAALGADELLEVGVYGASGAHLWTWTVRGAVSAAT